MPEPEQTIDDFCGECKSNQKLTFVKSEQGSLVETIRYDFYKCPLGHRVIKPYNEDTEKSYSSAQELVGASPNK